LDVLSAVAVILLNMPALGCTEMACVCVRSIDPRPTLESSAAVFVGRALEVTGADGDTGAESPDGLPYFQDSVAFVVEQSWKGRPPDTLRAAIDFTGPDCPARFTPGERYLVYAGMRDRRYVMVPARVRPS
jgi:hypothetical protein